MRRRSLIALILMIGLVRAPAYAGWLDEAVKDTLEGVGRRGVDESADTAYEGVKGKAKEAGKKDQDTAETGEAAPPPAEDAGEAPEVKPSPRKPAKAQAAAPEAGEGSPDIGAAEEIYSKYDFIPGDKVIFFDDFSDTDVGEFPRKWTLKGPGVTSYNNAVEVVKYQGKNFLRSQPVADKGDTQQGSFQYIRLSRKGDLPEKFTVEFDAVLASCPPPGGGNPARYFLILANEETPSGILDLGAVQISGEEGKSKNTRTAIKKADNKVHRVAVSVNGTFVKAYVDNQRVANDPDGLARPVKYFGMYMDVSAGWLCPNVMFTNFRLAEGGKDIKSALDTDGKIVTHGILFDTGSDRIKPESLPTLKMVLGLLEGNPALKFSIEGHTDNQGGKGVNQPLSERRAGSVKAWLQGKGIAADRLRSKGWGDSKPIDKNDTAEGRANNRRVEFVKIK